MRNSRGFTLIELMMVISIIGILAAIAIPAFLGQRSKAQTREGTVLAGDLRKDVVEFYWHTGRFPRDNEEAGLPAPELIKGSYVDSIAIRNGVIEVRYNDRVGYGDSVYDLRPAVYEEDPTAPVLWRDWDLPDGWIVQGDED